MNGGDEICEGAYNVPECNYDDGDCCLGYSSMCFMCVGHQCLCHLTGHQHCEHLVPYEPGDRMLLLSDLYVF